VPIALALWRRARLGDAVSPASGGTDPVHAAPEQGIPAHDRGGARQERQGGAGDPGPHLDGPTAQ
jgi:hypothetical protein